MYLLLIEDNPDLVENLSEYFEDKGDIVDIAYSGLTGLNFALENTYDVIVLDLMLPGMDGLEVCSRLRREGREVPVLMLTARDTLDNKLEGFHSGADDYLVKPFELPELEVRLKALSRRSTGRASRQLLVVDDLQFDRERMKVTRNGRRIELAPIPLKILSILIQRSPAVVSRDVIEREIWGDNPPDTDSLRAHIHALRSAIDHDTDRPLVHTIRGLGYQLASQHER